MNTFRHMQLIQDTALWGMALAASLMVLCVAWFGWVPHAGPAAGEMLALLTLTLMLGWFVCHFAQWIGERIGPRILPSWNAVLMTSNFLLWAASLYLFLTQPALPY